MQDKSYSRFEVGQVVHAVAAKYEPATTVPPAPYTEATLLDDMLMAYKFASSDADRKILKQTEGLGTSRTRIAVINNLISRGLLVSTRKGKRHEVHASDMARALVKAVPPVLTNVAMTAKWEIAFNMIESGEVEWRQVVDRQYRFVDGVVDLAKDQAGKLQITVPASGNGAGSSNAAGARKR
jgi:DNA topoisomerase-3